MAREFDNLSSTATTYDGDAYGSNATALNEGTVTGQYVPIPIDAEDTTKPVITRLGSTPVEVINGNTYTDDGATASDNIDGDITADIVTINPVDVDTNGAYNVTYNVDDAAGNHAAEVVRVVNVVTDGENDIHQTVANDYMSSGSNGVGVYTKNSDTSFDMTETENGTANNRPMFYHTLSEAPVNGTDYTITFDAVVNSGTAEINYITFGGGASQSTSDFQISTGVNELTMTCDGDDVSLYFYWYMNGLEYLWDIDITNMQFIEVV